MCVLEVQLSLCVFVWKITRAKGRHMETYFNEFRFGNLSSASVKLLPLSLPLPLYMFATWGHTSCILPHPQFPGFTGSQTRVSCKLRDRLAVQLSVDCTCLTGTILCICVRETNSIYMWCTHLGPVSWTISGKTTNACSVNVLCRIYRSISRPVKCNWNCKHACMCEDMGQVKIWHWPLLAHLKMSSSKWGPKVH